MAAFLNLSAMQKPYWQQRRDLKLTGKPSATEQKAEKQEKAEFFGEKIKQAPSKCQEDGKPLAGTKAINRAGVVAHILPKRKTGGVPSMATNPLNIVYLCGDCHTNMDSKGADFVTNMKIFPLMQKRVALMWPKIPDDERKNVPDYFRPENLVS